MDKRALISFLLAGALTGFLFSTQLKSKVPISSEFPADQIEAQNDLIRSFTNEESLYKSQIVSLREQIEEKQKENESIAKSSNIETLQKLKEKIGLNNVSGAGILIHLDDSPNLSRESVETQAGGLIHASDLRDIVNLLRTAKPQAIAINKQRIINTTPISAVGNSILVNSSKLAPPFQITAVGDPELMEQIIKNSSTISALIDRQKKSGIVFQAELVQEQTIPLYNSQFSLNYMSNSE